MILTVNPADFLKGKFSLPSSKSYSIRAFIISACGGRSTLFFPSNCDDSLVAMDVAKSLGADIRLVKNKAFVKSFHHPQKLSKINVGESGTVLRFLLPLVCLFEAPSLISGEGTLKGRPNLFLTKTLRSMGVEIKGGGPQESVPIRKQRGRMHGGQIHIDGSLSSQFISALLIACPLLKENTFLKVTGDKKVSETYIKMTQQILKRAGVRVIPKEDGYFISGQQKFSGLKGFKIPADYGLAAFFLIAAALIESNLTLLGHLKDDLVQADSAILDVLKMLGIKYSKTDKFLRIKGPFHFKGGDFSLKNAPDLVPIVAVLALFAEGPTRLYNIEHARVKESDRIEDLKNELVKIGADIRTARGEIHITPRKNYKKNCLLDPHHDHRLAMAFSVLGLKLGVRVKDIECTAKSYPDFVKDLKKSGAHVTKT